MALWQFTHLNKHGNFRQRIIHTKGALSLPGGGLGPHVMASRFKYKYEEPVWLLHYLKLMVKHI